MRLDREVPLASASPNAASKLTTDTARAADLPASLIMRACITIDPHAAVLQRMTVAARLSGNQGERSFLQTQLPETWQDGNVVVKCLFTMFPHGLPDELAVLKSALSEKEEISRHWRRLRRLRLRALLV